MQCEERRGDAMQGNGRSAVSGWQQCMQRTCVICTANEDDVHAKCARLDHCGSSSTNSSASAMSQSVAIAIGGDVEACGAKKRDDCRRACMDERAF